MVKKSMSEGNEATCLRAMISPFLLQYLITLNLLAKGHLDSTQSWSLKDQGLSLKISGKDHLDSGQSCLDTAKISHLIIHICSHIVMHYVICEAQG